MPNRNYHIPNFKLLIKWLREQFDKKAKDSSFAKDMKKWDWSAMIVCFLTAFIFWVFHSLNEDHTSTIEIPVNVKIQDDNVVALQEPPDHVSVNATGNGWTLLSKSLGVGNSKLNINLEEPVEVKYLAGKILLKELSQVLKGLKVNYIVEDTLAFNYDTLTNRKVAVEIDTSSFVFQNGYRRVGPIKVYPDSVIFRGPSTELKRFPDHLILRSEDTEPIAENLNEYIPVRVPVENENTLVFSPNDEVKVSFDVYYFISSTEKTKLFRVNFPGGKNSDDTFLLEPEDVYISYVIREDLINSVDTIPVIIDYKDIDWTDSTVTPKVFIDNDYYENIILSPNKLKVLKNKN
ncbi:hypothetical protein KMW28_00465 [Flammeovirga yaeyamensis]|uniref:YbbR-like domain-containing protein n=1 Tax=Flammeovirga yaeyamensis TaxID=367791 RepID=A0AAX1N7U6_9BACT|nr:MULTISPECIES: hypothetical protein [Flammeovirga]ANQ50485.2 hypothetical protein MY04_3120 [Flammeovirga sp. MY04]MBB3700673.1 hypothetical protein [Flammeovirga yaeyamensis]NMF37785.1 hypothetical protein [Flammeovirga yaeyamensis]QWG02092.1 hypothetical protein KMW28_00465 [Flammeovirga yaeyamensis]